MIKLSSVTAMVKTKKIIGLLVSLFMLANFMMPFGADAEKENVEILKNGGFEELSASGTPIGWTSSTKAFDSGSVTVENKRVHEGKNAVKQFAENGACFVTQSVTGLVGGTEYELSAWFYAVSFAKRGPGIKIEFYKTDESGKRVPDGDLLEVFSEELLETWVHKTFKFTAPAEAVSANIMFRMLDNVGEVYWDELSVKGQSTAPSEHESKEPIPADPALIRPPVQGAGELIANGDFEKISADGVPENWESIDKTFKDNVKVDTTAPKSGTNSIRISTETGNNPWIRQMVPVDALSEYQLTVWVRTNKEISGRGFAFKYEFYKAKEGGAANSVGGDRNSEYFNVVPNGTWMQLVRTVIIPENASYMALYVRMYGTGTVFYDDVSCYKISEPKYFDLSTDDVFYYTESYSGEATVVPNIVSYPELETGKFDFRIKDGDKIIKEKTNVTAAEGYAKFAFEISDLTEKGKEYRIEASAKNAAGEVLSTKSTPVYRYDRPKYLRADGVFEKNGKVVDPIFAYHVRDYQFADCAEAGINVAQSYLTTNLERLVAQLDTAQKSNIMLLVTLYNNMKPAGHETNVAFTKKAVEAVKDHPAVFGYVIMDEPFSHNPEGSDELLASYKAIRDIDPNHPVYVMEAGDNLEEAGKYTDIFGIDPYPGKANSPLSHPSNMTERASKATNYLKPVHSLLQAFDWNSYFPTENEMRNMIYQTFFKGGIAVGYYEMEFAKKGTPLNKTELWPTLTSWYQNESKDIFDYFAHRKYKTFSDGETDIVRWDSYVKNNEIYFIILSRNKNESVNAEIPLTDTSGNIKLNGFTGTVYAGGKPNTISGTDTLSVSLEPSQAVIYKITSKESIDFSSLHNSAFYDLAAYPWARAQIEDLEEKGIITGATPRAYAPGKKITRADFAMFLIRALGLTSDSSENFSDVKKDAYYAKELAIGKSLGILKGTGDGTFNPLEEITRQDMMVICARGMRLTAKLGDEGAAVTVFSDALEIAGYAVNDIGAMVKKGIVKGNADGTINPKGYTTRAEAAVVMHRIVN